MKTIQELYSEIIASEELKEEFTEAILEEDTFKAFLKKYDCDASIEDFTAYIQEISEESLDDDALDAVAGGAIDPAIIDKAEKILAKSPKIAKFISKQIKRAGACDNVAEYAEIIIDIYDIFFGD